MMAEAGAPAAERQRRALPCPLYLVTDRARTEGRSLVVVVEAALRGGARWVQFREKDLAGLALTHLGDDLRAATRRHGALLLVNDRVDVALAVEADGAHLARTSMRPADVRPLVGPDRWIGASAHSVEEAREAEASGADFVVFGPVFATPSKAPYGPPVGLDALRAARLDLAVPVVAIGGIKAGNLDQVAEAGADGFAVISAILAAPDPEMATRSLLDAWHRAIGSGRKEG
jgi:thiamine-phosphate pyrophosphorylase